MSGFCALCGSTSPPAGRSWSRHDGIAVAWKRCATCNAWSLDGIAWPPVGLWYGWLSGCEGVMVDEAWRTNLGLPPCKPLDWLHCKTCGALRPFIVARLDDYDAFGYPTGRTYWRTTCAVCKEE